MKILSAEQIRAVDQYTIENTPISSINLMENAGRECALKILSLYQNQSFSIFCGTGNNGGDGLVIARHLFENGKEVHVFVIRYSNKCSVDFDKNLARLKVIAPFLIQDIHSKEDLPILNNNTVVVDAIFGSGLSRPLQDLALEAVRFLNSEKKEIIAIDLPSGLFAENNSLNTSKSIIKATHTLSFELPKLVFFFPSFGQNVGKWNLLQIGLDNSFIQQQESKFEFIDKQLISNIIKKRNPFSHKGTYGHALFVSGSYGKIGAAILGSRACLRGGIGLLSVLVPRCGYSIIQIAVPEAMVISSQDENNIMGEFALEKYDAIGIGPGIGTHDQTKDFLKWALAKSTQPLVIDADALNIISKNKTLLSLVPKESILTPHLKEFERLFGKTNSDYDRINKQRRVSKELNLYILLKGRYSSISCPDGSVYFNSTGNPGMATAGNGDVLTGIITALLGQKYTAKEAAVLGAYLHGLSGDLAKHKIGQEALIASDVVENIGFAFKVIHHDSENQE